jgi:Raf kinase inhibitor-like YbhB/YbcL family protein
MTQNDPFAGLQQVPSFTLTSNDLTEGAAMPLAQMSGELGVIDGKDISPHLAWTGAPHGTRSYALTMYCPDTPSGSGFWHWAVVDLPDSTKELPSGAGDAKAPQLPGHAFHLPNDTRVSGYLGAGPDAADGPHRYYFVVHALDIRKIELEAYSTPAWLGLYINDHVIARASLMVTAEIAGVVNVGLTTDYLTGEGVLKTSSLTGRIE